MSEMDELHQATLTAQAAAGEARNHSEVARELASRIASAGMATGFGNDPSLVIAAGEQLSVAAGGLAQATAGLDDAVRLITQARQSG